MPHSPGRPSQPDPGAGPPTPPTSVEMHSADVEEATAEVGRLFHPHELTRVETTGTFEADLSAVATGPIVAGRIRYNSNSDLYCPAIDGFHVNIPIAGRLISESAGVRTTIDELDGVVYDHDADARLVTPAASQLNIVALKFNRDAVENVLADIVGAPVPGVHLRGSLNLSARAGLAWRSLVLNTYVAAVPNAMLTNPVVAEPLNYSIIAGLLSLIDHGHTDALEAAAPATAPVAIRRAMEFIDAHAELPLTPTSIARQAGLSVRSLQRGFREHVGLGPMHYLRTVRMHNVHRDLLAADPATTTVAAIAGRWGFYHLGRFSADYKRLHGHSPSETLKATGRTSWGRRSNR